MELQNRIARLQGAVIELRAIHTALTDIAVRSANDVIDIVGKVEDLINPVLVSEVEDGYYEREDENENDGVKVGREDTPSPEPDDAVAFNANLVAAKTWADEPGLEPGSVVRAGGDLFIVDYAADPLLEGKVILLDPDNVPWLCSKDTILERVLRPY